MSFVAVAAIGAGVAGGAKIVGGLIGAGKRKREQRAAESEHKRMKQRFANLDTSNQYTNLENTAEDLTVNTQQADFIAQHIDKKTFLKVQLKSKLCISKKYTNKDLWICFREKNHFYLYPHDEVMEHILSNYNVGNTESWKKNGIYYWPSLPKKISNFLKQYKFS